MNILSVLNNELPKYKAEAFSDSLFAMKQTIKLTHTEEIVGMDNSKRNGEKDRTPLDITSLTSLHQDNICEEQIVIHHSSQLMSTQAFIINKITSR